MYCAFVRISVEERGIEKNHLILFKLIRPEIGGNISFYHHVMGQETHRPPTQSHFPQIFIRERKLN